MNRQDLFESIGNVEEEILERSEKNKGKRKKRVTSFMMATAAMLAVIVGINFFAQPELDPMLLEAYAIGMAEYPETVRHPYEGKDEMAQIDSETYRAWSEQERARDMEEDEVLQVQKFISKSIWGFLDEGQNENVVYSPLNVYMALGMLAEVTNGNSQKQILDLLDVRNIWQLRKQIKSVWNAHYQDDGMTTSILANSLWLDENISYVPKTINTLADTYYASSYQGQMGSREFNQTFQSWMNEQTDGLLKEQIDRIIMPEDTIISLASTINYQAEWSTEFEQEDTKQGVFHTLTGEVKCDFMNDKTEGSYYWGEKFGAVDRHLKDRSGSMFFILPDEGVSIDELLEDPELTEFIFGDYESRNSKSVILNLSIPKFDVSSQMDLKEGLMSLGVTDIFDRSVADFSSLTKDKKVPFVEVSRIPHGARVTIDEKGVTAAAYTTIILDGAAPVTDEIDFVLDRPFIFVLNSSNNLPLFVGIVNQPN